MWEGGVVTWIRSRAVSPSASCQCRTAARRDAWVCRTAFGKPVVPELNTSTTSAAGLGLTWPSPGVIGMLGSSRCSIGISPASTGWSPTACAGCVIASACSASACFHAGLNSTTAAPSRQMACTATIHSGRFDAISAIGATAISTEPVGPAPASGPARTGGAAAPGLFCLR